MSYFDCTSQDVIDYRSVFLSGGFAQAIAGLDGQFLDCNHMFTVLTGYTKEELMTRTMFSLTSPDEMQRTFSYVCRCSARFRLSPLCVAATVLPAPFAFCVLF